MANRKVTPKRIFAGLGLVLLLALFGIAWARGGDNVADGDQALVATGSLRRGMTLPVVLQTLHPERMRRANSITYSLKPMLGGWYETYHALTPTRYVQLRFGHAPPRTPSGTPPLESLESWRLLDGRPPREDVMIERVLRIGPYRIRY